jgi:hypothetical protein
MRETQEKIRTTATTAIDAVLTDEQKDSFSKLLGEPFDFSKLRPGPGSGGPPDQMPPGEQLQPKAKAKRKSSR